MQVCLFSRRSRPISEPPKIRDPKILRASTVICCKLASTVTHGRCYYKQGSIIKHVVVITHKPCLSELRSLKENGKKRGTCMCATMKIYVFSPRTSLQQKRTAVSL